MDAALTERALTVEMVEYVDSCDRLDRIWNPELKGLKKDASTKKRRIRNAAPSKREYVVGEYVQAKEVYERAVAEAQTASWKRFCTAQDGESLWDGIYRVIRETGKNREDVLLQTDSGRVLGTNESATLLAKTFFPYDRVDTNYPHHAEVRRQTGGDDLPPVSSGGSARVGSHRGFAQYLSKFRLRDSPYCACDPAKIQDVLHVLEDCDMFLRERAALEAEFGVRISGRHFPEILSHVHRRGRLPDTLLRNFEGKTLSPTESQNSREHILPRRLCIDGYAIPHPNERKDRRQTCRNLRLSEDDPPFTMVEVKAVLRELNPKTAPGLDGLTADICIAAVESEMEVFLAIANKCLELAYFPTHWKTAHVVIIPKPEKEDYTLPKSYRPIGLLPIPER
ncbi:Putative 115 kDa protein in type-1 retrotransposable element R1DM [Eumeta japonica]|uniref:115 kDa protein in type-1 retrotransposable element R1DM n=1 Tax=Eumeta variegata TaxID=151549 RepID=A0A4C1UXG0_EUMVA|nr:Putative 115 kDa protein in type-1 retrotransposable element R1DM [Eumeta japonica]